LIKIESKEILNINFSTNLKEAENKLYDNLLDFEDNVIYYLKIRPMQKKI
jgi:succinate dehydrogenase flavin-adding protein (antitoxin of CptAB toxin-antitoxin module)